jgi:hypothetical protein
MSRSLFRCAFAISCTVVVTSACATPFAKVSATAVQRAAFDLDCPATSLQATQLGDTTHIGLTAQNPGIERAVIGVTGCAKKAAYVVDCNLGQCNAQLNADVKPASEPGKTQP